MASFSEPGAMRAGFALYRAFSQDVEDNRAALARDGKLQMPVLAVAVEASGFKDTIGSMMREVAERVETAIVSRAGHRIAEDNTQELADLLVRSARKKASHETAGAIHPEAMPVLLTTPNEMGTWLEAPWEVARELQRPLPDSGVLIVAKGNQKAPAE